jgi:hypothetical protein
MRQILRYAFFVILSVFLANSFFSGCTAPCSYPDQRGAGGASIRILNAMPDMPKITVFINGKAIVKDYSYDPPPGFGYITTYTDGTPLLTGDSELFVVTSDAAGKDTLIKQRVSINYNRQTIIPMGRGHRKAPQPRTALIVRLDDQIDQPDPTQTLIRFVDAVPDLDSLDIYFKGDTAGIPLGKPNETIHYGEVQPHFVLNSVVGLTITEAGNPNNVIFTFDHPFITSQGFFITVVVRGESKPLGTDFTAAPLVLSDAAIGNYILNFKTFAVRMVNATRASNLSLWIRSTTVSPEKDLNPRGSHLGVANYPNQEKVMNINPSETTEYIPLNIGLNGITTFWFARDSSINDTIMFIDTAQSDLLYSKIAIEENKVGESGKKLSHLTLPDTMTNPPGNFGRVRVINLSPDHASITVTLGGGTPVVMNRKDVRFFDVPIGNPTIKMQDGATTNTVTIPVSLILPISVYLLPEQSGSPILPIATSND